MSLILTINVDNVSLEYQCFEMIGEICLAKGKFDRINNSIPELTYERHDGDSYKLEVPQITHDNVFSFIPATLLDKEHGIIDDISAITAVGHYVVHGGIHFAESQLITPLTEGLIEQNNHLAPLHNPFSLKGIRLCRKIMPDIPQVAVFDTAFHRTIPDYAQVYPIPYEFYVEHDIRRYGFHGISHRYVSHRAAEMLGRSLSDLKLISCYLGNGCSITAIDGGQSVDTSMGFTPLEGLMMGTCSGNIDPAIIFHLARKHGMSIGDIEELLTKNSGLRGISGVELDFRELLNTTSMDNERVLLALKMFCYSVSQYIGKYVASLGGLDVLIFTGEIGENMARIRSKICEKLGFLGIEIDPNKNGNRVCEKEINRDNATVQTLLIPTNSELMIARDTLDLVQKPPEQIDQITQFSRLVEIVEKRDTLPASTQLLDQPNQKGNTEPSHQNSKPKQPLIDGRPVEPPELKGSMNTEPPFAPSAWLSIYNEKQ